jgi:hypothetical protein
VKPGELDRAYVLLSQAMSRVPAEEQRLFLARLVLLLLARSEDAETAIAAIGEAESAG